MSIEIAHNCETPTFSVGEDEEFRRMYGREIYARWNCPECDSRWIYVPGTRIGQGPSWLCSGPKYLKRVGGVLAQADDRISAWTAYGPVAFAVFLLFIFFLCILLVS